MLSNRSSLIVVPCLKLNTGTLKRNRMLRVASYYGGKFSLAQRYIPMFPEHSIYVEPFGGSGVVLLNKPRAKVEVYNDLEEGVYSLFHCLRDEHLSEMLFKQVKLTPYSRQEHARSIAEYDSPCSVVEKARRWFVATQASYASIFGETFSISAIKSRPQEWRNRIERFEPVIERMRGVLIENRDFGTVLNRFDTDKTFNFIDPPYVHDARTGGGGYHHEMSDAEHLRLLSVILSLKGLVMLCGYAHPMYDEALRGWHIVDTPHRCASGKTKKTSLRVERVWMNYRLADEMSSGTELPRKSA